MKAYIVEGHIEHEGFDILAVFSTNDKAKAYKDKRRAIKNKAMKYDFYVITVHDIDSEV